MRNCEIGQIFVDQDVLNSVCFNKVKFIDKKYNHFPGFSKKNNQKSIIHYIINKPWQNPKNPLSELFWKYAKLTPFYEEIIYTNTLNLAKEEFNKLNKNYWKQLTLIPKKIVHIFSKKQ